MNRITSVVLLALITLSCSRIYGEQENKSDKQTFASVLTEARQAIDKGNAQWVKAWEKGDAAMIATLFAKEGILLGRNGKSFKGPEQIFERQKIVMESAGKTVKATVMTVDLWLDGDTAYETGKYSYNFQENGKPVTEEGRYVTVWRRQSDGSWKIIMDMGVPS
jgi:uncharacterized protein (TIGR02246 family)